MSDARRCSFRLLPVAATALLLAAPTAAHAARTIELILDASGSMNAALPGGAAASGPQVVAAAQALQARGYTPITRVLELAANDLPADATSPTIILLSDGKEPCEGVPLAPARALAAKRVGLVVQAIGFVV